MKKHLYPSLVLVTLTALLAGCGSTTQPSVQLPAPHARDGVVAKDLKNETPQRWFVEFEASSGVQKLSASSFSRLAAEQGIKVQLNYSYSRLFSGVSVTTTQTGIAQIAGMVGVKSVYPVAIHALPEMKPQAPIDPEMDTAVTQTGVDYVWKELGYTGKGVKVGIIDSGIDIDHPDFKGRVLYQKDFVGDTYNADTAGTNAPYNPVTAPDNNADDCGGHGTHVAGIVGANGTIKGVAPDVTFGAYKVFSCEGSTADDVLLAALEQAQADKMDVVNMSLGSFGSWRDDNHPYTQALKKAVDDGMIIVVSAGNNGDRGAFASGSLAADSTTISVANFENLTQMAPYFKVNGQNIAISPATGAPAMPKTGTLEFAKTGTPTTTNDACNALPADSLKGKVALIRRGTCSFHIKAANAQAAGAAAVVLYNNTVGSLSPTVVGAVEIKIPVGMISKADGEALDALIAAGTTTLEWQDGQTRFPNARAGLVANSSSYGPNQTLGFKPDLGAPGNLIYSTYPLEQGGFATLSGTSMASPHVAGAVALLLEARPELKGKQEAVRAVLQNNAVPTVFEGTPILDSTNRQGAGIMNIANSILSKTSAEPSRIALGEVMGTVTKNIRIVNNSNAAVTYQIAHAPAVGTVGVQPGKYSGNAATVVLNASSITVGAGGSAVVSAQITPSAADVNGTMFGGYITMTSATAATLRVPYMGFKGDYQAEAAMTTTRFGALERATGSLYFQTAGVTFNLQDGFIPAVAVHLEYPAQTLIMDVLDGKTNQSLYASGSVYTEVSQFPRNSTAAGFHFFEWDGSLKNAQMKAGVPVTKTVADGAYRLRVRVLKAAGDAANLDHWESWTSPVFYIDKNAK